MKNKAVSPRMHMPLNWASFYRTISSRAPEYLFVNSDWQEMIRSLAVDSDAFWFIELQILVESAQAAADIDLDRVLMCWLAFVKWRIQDLLGSVLSVADWQELEGLHFGPGLEGLKRELMFAMSSPPSS